jgi:hypothetical protein
VDDIGLTRKQVHEARQMRDAEKAKPGTVRKTVEEKLQSGKEPTRTRGFQARSTGGAGKTLPVHSCKLSFEFIDA